MKVEPSFIAELEQAAVAEGFSQFGIAPAVEPAGFSGLLEWLERGFGGSMHYIADRVDAYRHPRSIVDGARSVIMLTYPYARGPAAEVADGQGRLARYLWQGEDYHDVIHPKLKRLRARIRDNFPEAMARGVVDTAPLLERDFARLAGLGWQGKNTLLINKRAGSYFFLAAIVTDLSLPPSQPHESSHCGTCRRCLDACPTDAFPSPGVLDATRCISYLTIENRGEIPEAMREPIGDWVFGCDVCQEVCPWNRPRRRGSPPGDPGKGSDRLAEDSSNPSLELLDLFEMDEEQFRAAYRKSPLWRARRGGLLRNAAIVLGNQRNPHAVTALTTGLRDAEPLVRTASAWALGRIGGPAASDALRRRLPEESDQEVRETISAALLG